MPLQCRTRNMKNLNWVLRLFHQFLALKRTFRMKKQIYRLFLRYFKTKDTVSKKKCHSKVCGTNLSLKRERRREGGRRHLPLSSLQAQKGEEKRREKSNGEGDDNISTVERDEVVFQHYHRK